MKRPAKGRVDRSRRMEAALESALHANRERRALNDLGVQLIGNAAIEFLRGVEEVRDIAGQA